MQSLVKLLERYYAENSRSDIGPPLKMLKGLETGKLIIADLEIGDEDIPVIIRFFRSKLVRQEVHQVEILRSSGGKVVKRRNFSALNANGAQLFRELIHFFENCTRIDVLTFDYVEISAVMAGSLGKALATYRQDLRWLIFRNCNLEGDEGFKAIAPHLCSLALQIVGFECCQLTNASLPFICSLLRAQECHADSLYWAATLRMDTKASIDIALRLNETAYVYSQGLVACSFFGNHLTGKNILLLAQLLRKSQWLLGINLAENRLNEAAIAVLVDELQHNNILQAVLLRNNPGLTADFSHRLRKPIQSSGTLRLNLLSSPLSYMMRKWMLLQCEEERDLLLPSLPSPAGQSVNASLTSTSAWPTTGNGNMPPPPPKSPKRQMEIKVQTMEKELISYSAMSYIDPQAPAPLQPPQQQQMNAVSATAIGENSSTARALDRSVPVQSPLPVAKKSSRQQLPIRDAGHDDDDDYGLDGGEEMWEYWPSRHGGKNGAAGTNDNRPPSRISMRPRPVTPTNIRYSRSVNQITQSQDRKVGSTPPSTRRASSPQSLPRFMRESHHPRDPVRVSSNSNTAAATRARSKSPPWRPSYVYRPPLIPEETAVEHLEHFHRRSASPPMQRYKGGGNDHHDHVHKHGGKKAARSLDADLFALYSSNKQPDSTYKKNKKKVKIVAAEKQSNKKGDKKKGKAGKKTRDASLKVTGKRVKKAETDLNTYRDLSQSVATATERLEHVSARLLEVAESLSESALPLPSLPQQQTLERQNTAISQAHQALLNNSHVSEISMTSTAGGADDPRLADLVKSRLQVQLKRILAAQMAAAAAAIQQDEDEEQIDNGQQRLGYYT